MRLLKALARQAVDSTPVWVMRQAGRYLPEYRAMREKMGSFLKMCQNPEIACTVTLQPLQRFDLDAAIIFSDILTLPDAMGLGLYFKENEGPSFARPVRTVDAINNLSIPDMDTSLDYVMKTIRLVAHELKNKVPLIGFCGSPWTVATYMVEGKSSKHFSIIKAMAYQEPAILQLLLEKVTLASCHYLHAQILAGANVIMVFDTWGGVLDHECFQSFSLHYMNQIVKYLKSNAQTKKTPIILFTKNGGQYLESIAKSGCDCVGIDWTQSITEAYQRIGGEVAVQGNLDPCVLYASPQVIEAKVKAILEACQGNGHIFNLGHGIYPDVDPERVQVMIEAVRKYSPIRKL